MKKNKKVFIISRQLVHVFMFFIIGVSAFAQSKVETNSALLVKRYCDSKGADSKAYDEMLAYSKPQLVANEIELRAKDTNGIDQTYCVYLIRGLVKKQTNEVVRKTYLSALSEIAFHSYNKTCNLAVGTMKYFKKNEFTPAVFENLEIIITQRPQYCSEAILMYGFAQSKEKMTFLKNVKSFQNFSKNDQYNFKLALVRMGDDETTAQFLYELANKKINDALVNSLLENLVYTRNIKVFQFLLDDLKTTIPNCASANNDSNEKILCAYRIIESLGTSIIDFPKLLNKYGEIEGDYPTALTTAINWYNQNKEIFKTDPIRY